MKLQKITNRLQKLHPKEIDLTLTRIQRLTKEMGNPQDRLNVISICGTNGKGTTAQAIKSILESANYSCDLYTSPHCKKINERFIFSGKEIEDDELIALFEEVEKINKQKPLTLFEFYTAAFILKASRSNSDVSILENGLFGRGDACSVVNKNLVSVITVIHKDHMDWLPEGKKNINQIIFEKTSALLKSKIIISEQPNQEIMNKIDKSIEKNKSKKIFFKKDFNYLINENDFFYYEDSFGGLKLPFPNLLGDHQISNVSTAIATLRSLEEFKIRDEDIKNGITKIQNIARLEKIKSGKLKNLCKKNILIVDSSHNPLGALSLKNYLKKYVKNKIYMILGMMNNKDHNEFVSYFKDIVDTIFTIDIPNQKAAIDKNKLKIIVENNKIFCQSSNSVKEALEKISNKEENISIVITGSIYLAGEVLNLN